MHRQVALADLIIINKTDLVSKDELNQVRASVRYETFDITNTVLAQRLFLFKHSYFLLAVNTEIRSHYYIDTYH